MKINREQAGGEWVYIEYGSKILTPEQQEAHRRWKENREREEARKELAKMWKKDAGQFYFASSRDAYRELCPEDTARLFYLATYLDYNGYLLTGNNWKHIRRKDLQHQLDLSRTEAYRFWKAVSEKYLFEDEQGNLKMSPDFFYRGKVVDHSGNFQRLYISSVRSLYRGTSTSRHKYLGYIFQMLPYVNIEYNTLCYNPLEKELDKVEKIPMDEFCERLGYSARNRRRLLSIYSEMKFPVGNITERLCSFVFTDGKLSTANIIINPRVFYQGKDPLKVAELGKFAN